jgi:hypothetical protein
MLFEENLKVIQEPSSTITDRNFLFEGKLLGILTLYKPLTPFKDVTCM